MRFINIRRICQLILICIRLNEISYQKSDRCIIWKFHCPNNFVSLFVRITGAPLYSRRDTNSWHMWPHYRYALERVKVIRDGFYVAAFSSVESALSLYFYLFGSFSNPDTVPRSTKPVEGWWPARGDLKNSKRKSVEEVCKWTCSARSRADHERDHRHDDNFLCFSISSGKHRS